MGLNLVNWLGRLKRGREVVIVSGLPRSGTSMVMQMLQAGGLEIGTDRIRTGDKDNPRGYFELERVKELDKGADRRWVGEYRGRAVKVISYLLRHLPESESYRVIFVERDLDEVLRSQGKMLQRRGETDGGDEEKMKTTFSDHLGQVRIMLDRASRFKTLYVAHRDIVENPAGQAHSINTFLGGQLDVEAMAAAVDPALYRNRAASGRGTAVDR